VARLRAEGGGGRRDEDEKEEHQEQDVVEKDEEVDEVEEKDQPAEHREEGCDRVGGWGGRDSPRFPLHPPPLLLQLLKK